jgi:hypothetical protein
MRAQPVFQRSSNARLLAKTGGAKGGRNVGRQPEGGCKKKANGVLLRLLALFCALQVHILIKSFKFATPLLFFVDASLRISLQSLSLPGLYQGAIASPASAGLARLPQAAKFGFTHWVARPTCGWAWPLNRHTPAPVAHKFLHRPAGSSKGITGVKE